MNHNYADWKLTQLLPEINPYSNIDEWVEIENEDSFTYILESEIEDEDCCGVTIRDAWTWEDIRLYLLSKGLHINYLCNDNASLHQFEIIQVKSPYDNWLSEESYKTYETTRKNAVLYCLNLLKENT